MKNTKEIMLLFPSEYENIRRVDSDYACEYEVACYISDYRVVLFNYDAFISGEPLKLSENLRNYSICIYRGWMLTPEQYEVLYASLQRMNILLINTPKEYNNCHLFPYVRDALGRNTPKSLVFPNYVDIDWNLVNKTFKQFIVKDYVKSEKGTSFPAYFTTPVEPAVMDNRIAEFKELRGKLYTGGIVLKEYVELKRDNDSNTNEYRAFFLKHQLLTLALNTPRTDYICESVPMEYVENFNNLPSNYYTVDFAETADGNWIVLETGDGQVSGLPYWVKDDIDSIDMYYAAIVRSILW